MNFAYNEYNHYFPLNDTNSNWFSRPFQIFGQFLAHMIFKTIAWFADAAMRPANERVPNSRHGSTKNPGLVSPPALIAHIRRRRMQIWGLVTIRELTRSIQSHSSLLLVSTLQVSSARIGTMTQNGKSSPSTTEAKSKTRSNCCKSKSYKFGGQNRLTAPAGKGGAKTAGCFVCNRCHMVYNNQTKAKACCLKKKGS